MISMANKIMKRIFENASARWVSTPRDFLDIGSREAVDQALSRLVKAGRLRRVGRGLYDEPRMSGVLKQPAPVDLDAANRGNRSEGRHPNHARWHGGRQPTRPYERGSRQTPAM